MLLQGSLYYQSLARRHFQLQLVFWQKIGDFVTPVSSFSTSVITVLTLVSQGESVGSICSTTFVAKIGGSASSVTTISPRVASKIFIVVLTSWGLPRLVLIYCTFCWLFVNWHQRPDWLWERPMLQMNRWCCSWKSLKKYELFFRYYRILIECSANLWAQSLSYTGDNLSLIWGVSCVMI